MSLLSDLLSNTSNQLIFIKLLNGQSILPRLLPFLNHPNLNVKQTTLNTIKEIIKAINSSKNNQKTFDQIEPEQNLTLLFRLIFQQSILMSSDDHFKQLEPILIQLWKTLCQSINCKLLVHLCFPYITTWLYLFMWPPNQQIEQAYLVNQPDLNLTLNSKEFLGSNQIRFEDKLTKDLIQIKCRLLASRLLAVLFEQVSKIRLDDSTQPQQRPIDLILNFLSNQINFKSGLQRFCFAILVINLCKEVEGCGDFMDLLRSNLGHKIVKCLDDENTIYFDEIALLFTRLQKDTRNLFIYYYEKFIKTHLGLLLDQNFISKSIFTLEDVQNLTQQLNEKLIAFENSPNNQRLSKDMQKLVQDFKVYVLNLIDLNKQAITEQEMLQIRSLFALASSSIDLTFLCERMNPLIRPLIECLRFESNFDLQSIAGRHLAQLLFHCSKRQPNPTPKILKNLLSYLCSSCVPQIALQLNINVLPDKEFYELNRYYGILSDNLNNLTQTDSAGEPVTPGKLKRSVSTQPTPNTPSTFMMQSQNVNNNKYEKRGAELAFRSIIALCNDLNTLKSIVPDLIDQPFNQIQSCLALFNQEAKNELSQIDELKIDQNLNKFQDLVNSMTLLEFILSIHTLNSSLLDLYLTQIPNMLKFLKIPLTSVRTMTSRCLSMLCKQNLVKTLSDSLEYILDCLDNNEFNLFARQGAIEFLYCLFDQLNTQIIPFIVIFIVPVLKRMCDLDWYVRSAASQCFATLVKLYPLAEPALDQSTNDALSQITCKNENILRMKLEQQDFLDQLMDNRKLKPFIVPDEVLIDVKLRPYQQQGVNWLAFLKKFNLHGILCDDMGLGKTIQSICILAGDHYEKFMHEKVKSTSLKDEDDDDSKFKPSIIICPSTLTNHWYHEIERFVRPTCLRPFIYSGSVQERENLCRKFFNDKLSTDKRANIFIVSYDIIRHDIQYLFKQNWNYCILDEGHLIKSSKTKLSKAIKQLRASHRLILTGTPIQNNVTELWCLFDFLLPGYLGSEKQFYLKYAKYVQSSMLTFQQKLERSMSSVGNSEKDGLKQSDSSFNASTTRGFNEMGILALESLHKQVLPFLLRRTKEEV
jgi:TATA-binding protein-associated factor